ncbi:gamma carbonic anhydrase family protein [Alkaliphilus peptidifermentans]|uniref:Carbonic anhydrase or acetyltransferase, isoleucine patch superfamily n=1 Tax=Alkaliphilus peptidifermentans DSM 18978 TaxID=1120976 RepID=A0A1G5L2V5_9FIRM|nr:gamma carbonic anhydrase family protein [Alkaliphilus peptidifermentans]SCZ07283.1 Carbonic anhydrase or acetyltransferase, isoleucine patch superfamily [Alkaliphilus peptidifermentans DSM 18978]
MIKGLKEKKPIIHESCFIAETADIIGDVKIGENSSIWYKAVVRGDDNYIIIGKNTNIQDNTVVHISNKYPTIIGDNVTVGHSAIVHACTVGNNTLIGMGAIILDGAEVGDETIIGAGALVPPNKKIPSGVLAVGSPAKVIRELTDEEKASLKESADHYVVYGNNHKEG